MAHLLFVPALDIKSTLTKVETNTTDRFSVAREQIDNELLLLGESMRELRTRRNSLSLICQLPPEMLSNIFFQFAAMLLYGSREYDISYVRLAHVCKHWRAVALGCPSLWGHLVFSCPRWTEKMISRSKTAPLSVRVDLMSRHPKIIAAVEQALKHVSRIKEIHISSSEATMRSFSEYFTASAPLLEHLSLSISRYDLVSQSHPGSSFALPEGIFSEKTPRLRSLELFRSAVPWNSGILAGLTYLKISEIQHSHRPNVTQILSILRRLNNLETLILEEALPLLPDNDVDPPLVDEKIHLSSLRHVHLGGHVAECAHIMAHISYPASTTVKLTCRNARFGPRLRRSFSAMFPTVITHVDSEDHLRTLFVQTYAPHSARIQAWKSNLIGSNDPSQAYHIIPRSAHIDLELKWTSMNTSQAIRGVVVDLCQVLPLSHVRALVVDFFLNPSEEIWMEAFSGLTQLRTLRVQNGYHDLTGGLFEILMQDVPLGLPKERRPKGGLFLPSLRQLVLQRNHLVESIDHLADCAIQRFERGAELRKLSIFDCYGVYQKDIDFLEEIVVDVAWDGVEQGDEDEDDDDNFDGGEDEEFDDPYHDDFQWWDEEDYANEHVHWYELPF